MATALVLIKFRINADTSLTAVDAAGLGVTAPNPVSLGIAARAAGIPQTSYILASNGTVGTALNTLSWTVAVGDL